MQIKKLTFNPLQENTYILYDDTKECIIIDAGCNTEDEKNTLDNFIKENDLKVVALLNTHCHFDHIFGVAHVVEKYKVPFWAHEKEIKNVERFEAYSSLYGARGVIPPLPTNYLKESESFKFGNTTVDIIETPGHSEGGVCLYIKNEGILISGDTLFAQSIGRSDLPGGDFEALKKSIVEKIVELPDETKIYPGHGPSTSLGVEIQVNPFVSDMINSVI